MKVGVGFRNAADSEAAGREATLAALADGRLSGCDLVLAFSTSLHDAEAFRDGIRSAAGPRARIVGGQAVGALTNRELGYGSFETGVAVFRFDGSGAEVISEGGLDRGERAVGHRLGEALRHRAHDDPTLLLYDSINRVDRRMKLNMATPLLEGLSNAAGSRSALVGAGLCGDMSGSPTYQIVDDEVRQQSAMAVVFDNAVRMHSTILHGCQPASDYRTVTRTDGATILELDGEPAVDVIRHLLGDRISPEEFGFFVTLGLNVGDPWAPYDESSYINRLCLKVDHRRGGLVMFEPDIREGAQVQFMHRNVNLDYIPPRIEALFDELGNRRPVFALYIDCAGRAASYAGLDEEDAAMVQRVVGDRAPLLGFYSGVEIGQILGQPRPLDWTGVFCLFSVET